MANFALWFAWQAIFPGNALAHCDIFVLLLGIGSLAALRIWSVDIVLLIGACAALGVVDRLVF